MNWLRRDHSASKEDYMVLTQAFCICISFVLFSDTMFTVFRLFSGSSGALAKAVRSSRDGCSQGLG